MYKVFMVIGQHTYSERGGERHSCLRAGDEEFDTVAEASAWILAQCLAGKVAVEGYRIFQEYEIIPVWDMHVGTVRDDVLNEKEG